jgi:2-haloacid dehalogenase
MTDAPQHGDPGRDGTRSPAADARTRPWTIVFDLGGVLIDWDPRHLYRQLFDDADEMERFLSEVTTADWNRGLDAGGSWSEAIGLLIREHPQQRAMIEAYRVRWPEMLAGPINGSVAVLADLRASGTRLYALSNWASETYPVTRDRFPFLDWFDDVVISGDVGVVKPDPRLFEHLIERDGVNPDEAIYIDDQPANVHAARSLGFTGIVFQDGATLRRELERLGALERGSGPAA